MDLPCRLVYLDADMILVRNIDHLFDLPPGAFYAVGDCYGGRETGGWAGMSGGGMGWGGLPYRWTVLHRPGLCPPLASPCLLLSAQLRPPAPSSGLEEELRTCCLSYLRPLPPCRPAGLSLLTCSLSFLLVASEEERNACCHFTPDATPEYFNAGRLVVGWWDWCGVGG